MKGRVFLNVDCQVVQLAICEADGKGVSIMLREKFATNDLANQMARTVARRLGLRKQGSGWQRRIR
jgi:hypothetical protein